MGVGRRYRKILRTLVGFTEADVLTQNFDLPDFGELLGVYENIDKSKIIVFDLGIQVQSNQLFQAILFKEITKVSGPTNKGLDCNYLIQLSLRDGTEFQFFIQGAFGLDEKFKDVFQFYRFLMLCVENRANF